MKKILFTVLFTLSLIFTLQASHIVGGELEMVFKRQTTYTIRLKLYVDILNANQGVIQSEIQAIIGIYEKGTNQQITQVVVPRITKDPIAIDYGARCKSSDSALKVETGLIIFSDDIKLDPAIYNNPAGYYMVWEDCCRNRVIQNIQNPSQAGMTFYTEFPPVIKNGQTFRNSSPVFPQLKGDYPCLNRPFTYDFSGTDANGDSLVYLMATPLKGHATEGNPPVPYPGPYDKVVWRPGYDTLHEIRGKTGGLTVDRHTGILSVTPIETGLFVFSVVIIEYRKGVRIGMVQRDFQLPITECPVNARPSISLTPINSTNPYNPSSDTLNLKIEKDTCFTVLVSDTVKNNATDEPLKITILANTIPAQIFSIPPTIDIQKNQNTQSLNFCLDACNKLFINKDTTFTISLVVTDAPKCPASLAYWDTLNVVIRFAPQINAKPKIGIVPAILSYKNYVNESITFDVYGTDKDKKDLITLKAEGEGFSMNTYGMSFNDTTGQDSISSRFSWTPSCSALQQGVFKVRFTVADNSCVKENKDTIEVQMSIIDTTTAASYVIPANLFTPNGDSRNDYFEIPQVAEGNCEYFFKSVVVYNRWGAKVYESKDPNFKWDGSECTTGLYYYIVDFNKRQYRSWLELVR